MSYNLTEEISKRGGTLLFHYYRGSYAYGTFVEGISDMDEGAIYICSEDERLGLPDMYDCQVSDERHDKVAYEIGRYFELLLKSNPTILEALFVPERCVIYEHPLFSKLRGERDKFISKQTITTLMEYSKSQILKARGLNKKIVNPVTERKTPIDFCYTYNGEQGTKPIERYLEEKGLKQIYCGLNHLPNMNMMHGCFYDWGQHIHMEFKTAESFKLAANFDVKVQLFLESFKRHINSVGDKYVRELYPDIPNSNQWYGDNLIKLYNTIVPKGFHGIEKADGTSNDIHLDSVPKHDLPLCLMSYSKDGYISHCREYREYREWVEKRNHIRYENNVGEGWDSKNMCHNIRLLNMSLEMAQNKGFNIDRTDIDRDLLLKIRDHGFTYDEIIKMSDDIKGKINDSMDSCLLPDKVDENKINNLLIKFRKEVYYGRECN